jgi:hypothetical protein
LAALTGENRIAKLTNKRGEILAAHNRSNGAEAEIAEDLVFLPLLRGSYYSY